MQPDQLSDRDLSRLCLARHDKSANQGGMHLKVEMLRSRSAALEQTSLVVLEPQNAHL